MFVLTIDTGNAAFDDSPAEEVARILREAADKIAEYGFADHAHNLRDINGNTVGGYAYSPTTSKATLLASLPK